VLGETVKAFKGLESPAVILTDVITPQEGTAVSFSTADFYVACTRARYRLIIIPVVEAEAYLRHLQNQAKE
jgi:ATP-dependent exoDNAse (exonuclease V) beta subunit